MESPELKYWDDLPGREPRRIIPKHVWVLYIYDIPMTNSWAITMSKIQENISSANILPWVIVGIIVEYSNPDDLIHLISIVDNKEFTNLIVAVQEKHLNKYIIIEIMHLIGDHFRMKRVARYTKDHISEVRMELQKINKSHLGDAGLKNFDIVFGLVLTHLKFWAV